MKILLAEDDAVSALVLSTKLKKLGHEVIHAINGKEAWALYQEDHPDIVITDWMMPIVDGLELTRLIRADHRRRYAYVIILTSLGGKGSFIEGLMAGADDFITKPYDIESLTARFRVAERMLSLYDELSQLRGLLQVCPGCRRIRDENNEWHPLEAYVAARSDVTFAESSCPDCEQSRNKAVL